MSLDKKKGYYGATVAAPVFKEIAQKIYSTTPFDTNIVGEKSSISGMDSKYQEYYTSLQKEHKVIPNVKGMSGMDAVALLENLGLVVKFNGSGKVTKQSKNKGVKFKKGDTILLSLS